MSTKTITNNPSGISRLYQISFEDGSVHFGRMILEKNYSVHSYLQDFISKYNYGVEKKGGIVTIMQRKVFQEITTLKCDIISEAITLDIMAQQRSLIKTSDNCLNKMDPHITKHAKDSVLPIHKKYIKVLTSVSNAEKRFFIESHYINTHGLESYVDQKQKHPLNSGYVLAIKKLEVTEA